MTRVLILGLRAWALIQAAVAVMWVLGPFGFGLFHYGDLPEAVRRSSGGALLDGMFTGLITSANLTDGDAFDRMYELSRELTGNAQVPSGAWGDINVGWSVQFTGFTWWQSVAWVALHVVPLVVAAGLWWALAGVLAQSRREAAFTPSNARRLMVAGFVLMLGAPLLSALRWMHQTWVAESSQIADRIEVPGYSFGHVPWTAIAAGVALVVLGQVWRRGALMERDLGGLV